jgi:uncharacterized membrane protein YdjX (TVP38/TMEM64 family)
VPGFRLDWWRRNVPVLLPLVLVAVGFYVAFSGIVDVAALLSWGDRIADQPAAIVGVVVVMAVLFTLAMPGSLCLWVVAPFHPPLVSVGILLTGSIAGSLGAYLAARWMGGDWVRERGGTVLRLLRTRGDFLTQCMLRLLPGFPHSVVNYACGMLGLPMATFLGAAVVGLAIKWMVYASAVHGAAEALEAGDPLSTDALIPMSVLAGFLLAATLLRRLMLR